VRHQRTHDGAASAEYRIMVPVPGLLYLPDFLTPTEEADLVARIAAFDRWETVAFHGRQAKRRSVSFGSEYVATSRRLVAAPPIPDFLVPIRDRAASHAASDASLFTEVIAWRYAPSAGIGWHTDADVYGAVVLSVSLGAKCRFDLKREGYALHRLVLEPRSLVVIGGEARIAWKHRIPPVRQGRYSITFRSIAPGRGRP